MLGWWEAQLPVRSRGIRICPRLQLSPFRKRWLCAPAACTSRSRARTTAQLPRRIQHSAEPCAPATVPPARIELLLGGGKQGLASSVLPNKPFLDRSNANETFLFALPKEARRCRRICCRYRVASGEKQNHALQQAFLKRNHATTGITFSFDMNRRDEAVHYCAATFISYYCKASDRRFIQMKKLFRWFSPERVDFG